ncbi:MAG: hypothetical protein IPL61_14135 [Myxococcales bacterium]|nr:hypothetical protein [Myxococcales bacterium]
MSQDEGTKYRVHSRERTQVVTARRSSTAPPTNFGLGSDPEIPVIPPLAAPMERSVTVPFGRDVIVLVHGRRAVTLMLPGGVRIESTPAEALALADALSAAAMSTER